MKIKRIDGDSYILGEGCHLYWHRKNDEILTYLVKFSPNETSEMIWEEIQRIEARQFPPPLGVHVEEVIKATDLMG